MPTMQRTALALALFSGFAWAQSPGKKAPSVTLAPIAPVSVTRGQAGEVSLAFRVAAGFDINSNTPQSELLILTSLPVDAPTDIVITKLTYTAGNNMSLPFAAHVPLNVYSGDF